MTTDLSDEIRANSILGITGDTEARKVFKIDTSEDLPVPLRQQRLFPLPTRNGVYRLIKGEGFHEFEPIGTPPKDFVSKLDFDLATLSSSEGESAFVHYCHNSGLLERFTGFRPLYKTNEGRFRSRGFSFHVGSIGPIIQKGVQCQVDGLFEGRDCIIIMEAKIRDNPDFIIRQLYYPFRHFDVISPKSVYTYFLRLDLRTRIYYFWQYEFSDKQNYSSIELVRNERYKIVERPRDVKGLDRISPKGDIAYVPQANSVTTIQDIPVIIERGATDSRAVAEAVGFTPRQALYYSEAAEALGLIVRGRGDGSSLVLELTPLGDKYLSATQDRRNEIVAEQMMRLPVMRLVWDLIIDAACNQERKSKSLRFEDLVAVIKKESSLSGTTPRRRASTIYRWFEWMSTHYGVIRADGGSLSLRENAQKQL